MITVVMTSAPWAALVVAAMFADPAMRTAHQGEPMALEDEPPQPDAQAPWDTESSRAHPAAPAAPAQPAPPPPVPRESPALPSAMPPKEWSNPPPSGTDDHSTSWSPGATWRSTRSRYDDDALAEMLNMSATVATKTSATVSRSPATVTVYSDQDIRRLGYYTLADLADVTAGYNSHIVFGEKVFESRGQKAGSFNNNKHLVLIDGIPVNHARGNKAMLDENFPLFCANRIEFLKGPASALYGTGAFFGVVNIAPKELEDSGFRAEARAGLGTQQSDKRVAANVLYRDDFRHAALHVGLFGKEPSGAFTGTTIDENNRFWDNQRSEFFYLTYGIDHGPFAGLKGGVIYSSKNGGLGEHWLGGNSPTYDDLTWVQMIPYLKYQRTLTRSLELDGYFKANRDTEKATAAVQNRPVSTGPEDLVLLYSSSVTAYEGLAELRWQPATTWNVIGGVNVNISHQNDGLGDYGGFVTSRPQAVFAPNRYTLTSRDIFQAYSTFLQIGATLPVLAALYVTAGARLDAGKAPDARFWRLSPRVGIVQELTRFLSVKLLYDTALRAPGIKEVGLNKEVRPQLPDPTQAPPVQPETIRSLEAGLAFNTSHISLNTAVFVNETRDALDGRSVRDSNGTLKNIFTNTPGTIVARGTEVELTLAASPDTRLFANYSFARAVAAPRPDDDAEVRAEALALADVPIHRVNAGASYRWSKPIDLTGTLVAKWVSAYRGGVPPMPDVPSPPPPSDPPGHLVVDFNLISRLTGHASIELLVRNLTNTTYRLPQGGQPYIPMPRRSFHLTLDYRW
jgi:outer membrane receptor for ferrienterochelin and colicins